MHGWAPWISHVTSRETTNLEIQPMKSLVMWMPYWRTGKKPCALACDCYQNLPTMDQWDTSRHLLTLLMRVVGDVTSLTCIVIGTQASVKTTWRTTATITAMADRFGFQNGSGVLHGIAMEHLPMVWLTNVSWSARRKSSTPSMLTTAWSVMPIGIAKVKHASIITGHWQNSASTMRRWMSAKATMPLHNIFPPTHVWRHWANSLLHTIRKREQLRSHGLIQIGM